jgi:uncharacterized membrane protein (UPF0127 family)
MMRRLAFNHAILALLWTIVLGAVTASASDPKVVEIATRNGVRLFSVEVAADDETRARGLMYRRELPEEHGMLFDFQREEPVAMWMYNTYISLDMIFIQGDGRILRIAERTEPLSDRIIPSGGPVRAVLEVPGGTAKKFGIAPGDRIGHPIFSGR